ncbi:MAG: RelA/SpoT family protein [Ectothiorhodospiraceae bacterium]|nr:RelA/SpoT family protein [Chromatiales bacterium]MCP5153574.1 RelA/SpoT family protein [Ectothiorhodospiraceae bacterium]
MSFHIDDLCNLTDAYLEPDQVRDIHRAYEFGAEAHQGQMRASGEPYIEHPVQVARILADMRMDAQTIVAAILHDVMEDTPTAKGQIASLFGDEVADLVDGVSKLTQISFESKAQAQAEYYRKMMLAMARDLRVILVKLADRLHNMRTLDALRIEKRRQIARETLEIYAPIANRLGLNSIRLELEDLGFAALYPMRYRVLAAELKKVRGHRKHVVKKIEQGIKRRLRQEGLQATVVGREKHLYSLFRKMREKRVSFREVLDVHAFRVIVDTPDTCYRVLGVVHNLYKPMPGKFKDYIALPKANGYQSLHTVLFGPYGAPIEIQVRSADMHAVAESGIAAHWMYKNGSGQSADKGDGNAAHQRARRWVKELLEMQKQAGDSIEFLENLKVDLFPKDVYVFTPRGDIMELPRGATGVDLAYAVHTDIGNACIAVKIDGRYAPLRTQLATSQTVEVVTAPWGRPNANWLDFVVTGKARAGIRNYLKHLRAGEAIELGRRLLTQSLAQDDVTLDDIPGERLDELLGGLNLPTLDALLEEIGLGKRIAPLVARRLARGAEDETGSRDESSRSGPLLIRGAEGMVINFGKCCHPIPGDSIVGYVSAGRGLVIHTSNCRNIAENADHPENWVEVGWEPDVSGEFPVEIRVDTANQKGVLATVASSIADTGANIENVSMDSRDGAHASLVFLVSVRGRRHLATIMRRIRGIPAVGRIARVGG